MAAQVNAYVITYIKFIACNYTSVVGKKKKDCPFTPYIVVEDKTIWSMKKSQIWVGLWVSQHESSFNWTVRLIGDK